MPGSHIVDDFHFSYLYKRAFYENAAQVAARECRELVLARSVPADVEGRAKEHGFAVLTARANLGTGITYANVEAVYEAQPDLGEVAIAIAYPNDHAVVENLLLPTFDIHEVVRFAEADGYSARHYRVSLRASALNRVEGHYSLARLEIKVATPAMHASTRLAEEVIGKTASYDASQAARNALQSLKTKTVECEAMLALIHAEHYAGRYRGTNDLTDHYQLAAFLQHEAIRRQWPTSSSFSAGRTDALWVALRERALLSRAGLALYLDQCAFVDGSESLVDQLVAVLQQHDTEFGSAYDAARASFGYPWSYVERTAA